MHRSLVFVVVLIVMAVHGWLLLGPVHWWQARDMGPPDPVQTVQAVWLPPPTPAVATPPAALLMPKPKPLRPYRVQNTAVPRPQPVSQVPPVPLPDAIDAQTATAAQEETAQSAAIAINTEAQLDTLPDPTAPTAPAEGALPASAQGPALQVHSATGQALALHIPSGANALPQQLLLRFKVEGMVKGMQYHAHAELQWHIDGQHYQARQSVRAFLLGSLEQSSTGQITEQGLQPQRFVDRRLARQRSVHWDWGQHMATFEPERPPAPIGPGAQDRLSVFLQLAAMLQSMPQLRSEGARIDIPTLGSRSLQMWSFVVQAPEVLQVPAGEMPTLRLLRLPQPGNTETAQLWLHPERGYVPVRIRMEESNGDVMDLTLKS
ncbi:MAG: DUF3108 domain-containing protein [Comamonas sp.]|nr:DUF3108 domain-containing protein [Candidatus Comamonas equi]